MDPRDMEPLDITDPAALENWGPATPEEEEALVEGDLSHRSGPVHAADGREGGMSDEARTALERAVRMWARIEDDRVYLGDLVNRAEELGASVPEFVRGAVRAPKTFNHEEAGIAL